VLLAVQGRNRCRGFLVGRHFDKTEALAAASVPIIDDLGGNNRTMRSEQRFEFRAIHLVAQVPDIQLLTHLESPCDMGRPRPEVKWFFPGQIERGRHSDRCGREETDTEERQDTRHFPDADTRTRHLNKANMLPELCRTKQAKNKEMHSPFAGCLLADKGHPKIGRGK
jgi:hypothetical protein